METFNVEPTSERVERPTISKKKLNPAFATNISEGAGPETAGGNGGNGEWTLGKKTNLTPLTAKFDFVSTKYAINPLANDIRHLGRHMKVKILKTMIINIL